MTALLLSLLLACSAPPTADDFRVRATLAPDVATVVDVRWDSDLDVDGATLNAVDALGERWELDISSGQAWILGLPPDTDVELDVVFDVGGDTVQSEELSLTTGAPGNDLPGIDVEGDTDRALGGSLMMTTTIGNPSAAVMIDGEGRFRWWVVPGAGTELSRARLSADGQHVLALPVNVDGRDTNGLMRFSVDGTQVDSVEVRGQHHDFVEHSDGTVAFLVHSEQEVDGDIVLGDKIVEVAPDGTETVIWDAWDWLFFDGDKPTLTANGWTHANALVFDEAAQTYALSMLGIQAIASVDRASGELIWLMGTRDSDFQLADGSRTIIDHGHQFDILDGTLLAFENGDPSQQSSRAVEYTFDPDEAVMELVWEYRPTPSLYTFSMGDVERLDNGDTIVDFSANGSMVQVDPAGDEVWTMDLQLGAAFGYFTLLGPAGSF